MLDPEKSRREPIRREAHPILASDPTSQAATGPIVEPPPAPDARKHPLAKWAVAAVLTVALLSWIGWAATRDQRHMNWNFVNQAREATATSGADAMVFRSPQRDDVIVSSILLSAGEAEGQLTQEFRDTLHSDGRSAAAGVVAQSTGPKTVMKDSLPPSALWGWVADGRADFYRLHIADACFEDGDVVDVHVNDEFWVTVKLLNRGMTIPVPLSPGKNRISLTGKHDGGSGITVLLTTTEGHYFCRPIATGEHVEVTAVRP